MSLFFEFLFFVDDKVNLPVFFFLKNRVLLSSLSVWPPLPEFKLSSLLSVSVNSIALHAPLKDFLGSLVSLS